MKRALRFSLSLGLGSLLAAAGCGGGDSGSNEGTTAAAGGDTSAGGSSASTGGAAGKGTGGSGAGKSGSGGAVGPGGPGAGGGGTGGKAAGGGGGTSAGGASHGGSGGTDGGGTHGGGSAGTHHGGSAGTDSGGSAGASGSGGCSAPKDCPLPDTSPADCVEAACNAGVCTYLAKDSDGDGFRKNKCKVVSDMPVVIQLGNDCDDTNAKVNPKGWDGPAGAGHPGACDGIDEDCSGTVDDGTLADGSSCVCTVGDVDSKCAADGAGKPITFPGGTPVGACTYGARTCAVQSGSGAATYGPCAGAVGPAVEECNGVDDDCNGMVDDNAFDQKIWHCDQDGDGHLDANSTPFQTKSCVAPPTGVPVGPNNDVCNGLWILTGLADDCNDADASVYPGNTEACDGKDNNCNGTIDENVTTVVWVLDADGDGFGAVGSESAPSCAPPDANPAWKSGLPATDCDDTRKTVNTLGTEVCDGFDNNCAGGIDEGSTCAGTVDITATDPPPLTVHLTQSTSKTPGNPSDPFFDDYPVGIWEYLSWQLADENTVTVSQTLVEAKSTSGGDQTVGKGNGSTTFTVSQPITAVLSGSGTGCNDQVSNFSGLCKLNEFPAAGQVGGPTGFNYFPGGEQYKIVYLCVAQPSSIPKGGVCGGPVTQCNSCNFTYSGKLRVTLKPYLPAPM